jgi:hypothetical protein
MPVLPNPRHEACAQALMRGVSATTAYVQAGDKASYAGDWVMRSIRRRGVPAF